MARDIALEQEIRAALDAVHMIDTHEHLDTEDEFAAQHVDFGRLFLHYACCDLISAGCPLISTIPPALSAIGPNVSIARM